MGVGGQQLPPLCNTSTITWAPEVPRDAAEFSPLSAALLLAPKKLEPQPWASSPCPGGAAHSCQGKPPSPHPSSLHWVRTLKIQAGWFHPCALISRPQRRADPGLLELCASQTAGLPRLVVTCSPTISVMCWLKAYSLNLICVLVTRFFSLGAPNAFRGKGSGCVPNNTMFL